MNGERPIVLLCVRETLMAGASSPTRSGTSDAETGAGLSFGRRCRECEARSATKSGDGDRREIVQAVRVSVDGCR